MNNFPDKITDFLTTFLLKFILVTTSVPVEYDDDDNDCQEILNGYSKKSASFNSLGIKYQQEAKKQK